MSNTTFRNARMADPEHRPRRDLAILRSDDPELLEMYRYYAEREFTYQDHAMEP